MRLLTAPALIILLLISTPPPVQRYTGSDGRLRVALVKQPFSPTGTSAGPGTMANGGIQQILTGMGAIVVMGGVRLTDPLEQSLLDQSSIEQLTVDDLRNMSRAVFAQLDRLNQVTDKIYVHIDMDVLDPREVMGHGNKVPNGPSSEQLARLFEVIFSRYPKASAIGFATIPSTDEGGLSIAAVNRMIAGAVRGVRIREGHKTSDKL